MNQDKNINKQLPTVNQMGAIHQPDGRDQSAPTDGARPVLSKRISDTRILQHMAHALYITLNLLDEHADPRPGPPREIDHTIDEASSQADPDKVGIIPRGSPGLIFFAQERRGRAHRIVIYQADDLSLGCNLPFVGFISGRSQPILAAISAEIEQLDRQLVVELASAPGVLSYSSLQLRSGNWYNLAVFGDAGAKAIFHRLNTHTHAAHHVAPRYYDWIRLHHGIIVGTLADGRMRLQYTRSITFEEQRTPTVRLIIHQLAEGAEGKEHER